MAESRALDRGWLRAHPLPEHRDGTDKNSRGHVVAIGGSRRVPGGLGLTGEAVLRAGAGKVQLATVESCALGLGLALPEAGVIALAETTAGEIDAARLDPLGKGLERCDSVVLGPAMADPKAAGAVLGALLGTLERQALLVDAVALHAALEQRDKLRAYGGPLVLTPNPDELESLLEIDGERIAADPGGAARAAAEAYGAVVAGKGGETWIAAPGGPLLRYPGGGIGLATGGSGDVLAGLIAALLARGAAPLSAAAWGVWLHGEAGRKIAGSVGPLGFLARELLPPIPALLEAAR